MPQQHESGTTAVCPPSAGRTALQEVSTVRPGDTLTEMSLSPDWGLYPALGDFLFRLFGPDPEQFVLRFLRLRRLPRVNEDLF